MSLKRYWLFTFLAFTIALRPAMGIYHSGLFLDHVEASVMGFLLSGSATAFAWSRGANKRDDVRGYLWPTLGGLVIIALIWAR